jgi:Zn-dependent M28 family amino/carboxypeptidase
MRIPRTAVGLFLAASFASCGGSAGPVDGARAMEHVRNLVALGPRPPGSDALWKAGDYIQAELRALGLTPQEQVWTDPKEKIRFRNVWVQVPGEDPAEGPILAIGSHYDTKVFHGHATPAHNFSFVGAIDGGGASGLLIELARHLVARKNRPNIWLIWFDGEESLEVQWNDDRALFGSRHFVATMQADKTRFPKGLNQRLKVFVLLDLIGDRDIKLDKDVTSNPDLNRIFLEAAKVLGEEQRMFRWELPAEFKDDHLPFRQKGVTVVDLIDFAWRIPEQHKDPAKVPEAARGLQAWWHTEHDTLDKMSPRALAFAGNLVMGALPAIESTFYGAH